MTNKYNLLYFAHLLTNDFFCFYAYVRRLSFRHIKLPCMAWVHLSYPLRQFFFLMQILVICPCFTATHYFCTVCIILYHLFVVFNLFTPPLLSSSLFILISCFIPPVWTFLFIVPFIRISCFIPPVWTFLFIVPFMNNVFLCNTHTLPPPDILHAVWLSFVLLGGGTNYFHAFVLGSYCQMAPGKHT